MITLDDEVEDGGARGRSAEPARVDSGGLLGMTPEEVTRKRHGQAGRGNGMTRETMVALAAPMFAAGLPYAEIHRRLGVSRDLIAALARDPVCRALVEELQTEMVDEARAKLRSLVGLAVGTLEQVASDENARGHERVKAAEAILDRVGLISSVTSASGETLPVTALSDEELEAMVREAAGAIP